MKKRTIFLIHLCYWVYTFIFMEIALQLANGKQLDFLLHFLTPLAISNYFIFISIFYLNYFLILPKLLNKKKYILSFLAWILLIILFITMRYYFQEVFLLKYFNTCNYCTFN